MARPVSMIAGVSFACLQAFGSQGATLLAPGTALRASNITLVDSASVERTSKPTWVRSFAERWAPSIVRAIVNKACGVTMNKAVKTAAVLLTSRKIVEEAQEAQLAISAIMCHYADDKIDDVLLPDVPAISPGVAARFAVPAEPVMASQANLNALAERQRTLPSITACQWPKSPRPCPPPQPAVTGPRPDTPPQAIPPMSLSTSLLKNPHLLDGIIQPGDISPSALPGGSLPSKP